ncbi:AAA family ATPase [Inconstantimicrobium porci]|uniref:endopeptidase La n=1 Tax=Inconstantimicrobium porci TaxID=2652291 RepID=A0A7X2MXY9_9CLOT|nr:AAA family ATPase [Inconstantimicrobium porci]MDD6771659.1 AAA family ATPase [Inconstantimicrobium porci]MSR91105.1 AAA family ATPase [Inconstantimicrobium porci]
MVKELTPAQVVFNFEKIDIAKGLKGNSQDYIPNMDSIYDSIDQSLSIRREGYNLYIIDNFSKEKLNEIIKCVSRKLTEKNKPKDILYVTYEEKREPKAMFLSNGMGQRFKECIDKLKKEYQEKIFDFYNSSLSSEKDNIIDGLAQKRNQYMDELTEMAEKAGFNLKTTMSGFAFIPLKENETAMTEKEYDELKSEKKVDIADKAAELKAEAQKVLEKLKELELAAKCKLKEILKKTLSDEMKDIKNSIKNKLENEQQAVFYIDKLCDFTEKSLVDNYSISYESDVEEIEYILSKYNVNLLVDNSSNKSPLVIYEENPTVQNLIGDIEYETDKGAYITDISLIKAGDILRANEGCLILNANSVANTAGSYQQLRKFLFSGKVNFDYNKSNLELLTLNTIKPEPIKADVKVILIGDFTLYNLFYSYDDEFKKIFKLTSEYNPIVSLNSRGNDNSALVSYIMKLITDNNLLPIEEEALVEVARILSRKAECRNKIILDEMEIDKMLFISNDKAVKEGRKSICRKNIVDIYNKKSLLQQEMLDYYLDRKINIDVTSKISGSINGLSVIDTGRESFGKPIRITCLCSKGSGKLLDFQKENNLSGPIHEKSISILSSLFNSFIDPYSKLPVDFNLSFEQIYGKLEGDSASVAEIVCMISALSRIGVRQNIAVTGSVNQFGDVQPIGGVNEKIEGFFNICNTLDTIENKGVLIPSANVDDVVLNEEVENAIKQGKFKLYSMDTIYDAIEVLMCDKKTKVGDVLKKIKIELKLYENNK